MEMRTNVKEKFNILLTSAGRRSYLVRYFKEAIGKDGLVHAANSEESPALFVADRSVLTPLIYDKEYIPFLLNYCRENQISLLISLFDIDLPILAAHRKAFSDIGVLLAISEEETVRICNDKWETYQFLCRNHLPSPKTYLSLEEAEMAIERGAVSWPLMVKPRWGMGSLSIFQADDKEELRVFYRKALAKIHSSYLHYEACQDEGACILIQERLNGEEYGMDVINDLNGNYCNTIVKRKVGMRSGETDSAVTEENSELEKLGKTVSGLLSHRGNLDVDVFLSGGVYYILEMNARFGGGYPFSHAAGVDLPRAMVAWARGLKAAPDWLKARPGVRAMKDIQMLVPEK